MGKYTVTVIALSIAALAQMVLSQTNYCSTTLCSGGGHIACNNNGAFGPACSSDRQIMTMTPTIRDALVRKHNELRNKIAQGFGVYKPAARMAYMKWNAELAKLAELNVKQCAMKHDKCRNTPSFKYAGQNLAYSSWYGTTRTVQAVSISHVQMWFDEQKDASMTYINSYSNPTNGKVIGHFTQVVQDKATDVGCAILRHTKDKFWYQFTACNYAFTNVMSRTVYQSSTKATSGCKTGTHPTYKFLCSLKETYAVNNP